MHHNVMLKLWFFTLMIPAITFAIWSSQVSGTNSNLKDVDFVDTNHGWVVGGEDYTQDDAVILYTSNGGNSWVDQTPFNIPNGIDQLIGVAAVDTLHCWAVGIDTLRCSLILKTTDGGNAWFRQVAPIDTPHPVSVCFIDTNNGWTSPGGPYGLGYQQVIFHTMNSGGSWSVQGWSGYDGGSCRIFFADLQHGYVAGGTEMTPTTRGYIMRTTDGGNTWDESYHWGASIPWTWPLMTGVHFPVDNINGWGCGLLAANPPNYTMRIVHTTNGGDFWDIQLQTNSFPWPWDIHFVDLQNGWVVCDSGVILRTTNGGTNWYLDTVATSAHLRTVDFVDINNGWAVGSSGTILKYTGSGGISEKSSNSLLGINDINLVIISLNKRRLSFFYSSPWDDIVIFSVYNTIGQEIFSDKKKISAGTSLHHLFLPQNLSSGIYFLRAEASNRSVIRKLVLVK